MDFFASRETLEGEIHKGCLEDAQIAGCDISGFEIDDGSWKKVSARDVDAHGAVFRKTEIRGSEFFRCGFMRAVFSACRFDDVVFDGVNLIKSGWKGCRLKNIRLKNSCLQRAEFFGAAIFSSHFTDFEAIGCRIENSFVANSVFSLTGSGMNGFSGGRIISTVFYNCRFEGGVFDGESFENCAFVRCGNLAHSAVFENGGSCAGGAFFTQRRPLRFLELFRREEAAALLGSYV
ncbi:MAG: pentapeptide repeat-containing protein [Spirochaetales bacterium]|jgi:uncharacterized protein YjbI with pentapeptide repeats|nr:pentapeptide repeat-containing protein [Spirochaetales bacterium]